MPATLDSAYDEFSRSIEQVRQHLMLVDSAVISSNLTHREAIIGIRAASYIWVAAALEAYVNGLLSALLGEIETHKVAYKDLGFRLFAMSAATGFESLKDLSGLKSWRKRSEMLSSIESADEVSFGPRLIPLDGRTIKRDHFETIWDVFGFSGAALPGHSHKLALEDLAGTRNRLAHGETDPIVVGKSKTTPDMLNLIQRIDEVAMHLWTAADNYLAGSLFRR
ncbi:MAE_28990/MAE_18760 family HEPN-like nuclease [Corallococcus exiguus]|uniref:MAE_28990/MAE_18760 family HEPN-like nuclease n=1 Tax=Corallococcus exiguus TaxID=83462 RepID=UPI0015619CDF|nr:MAE_28990/MAE_18760 family HEPN-like nuclease [Corallococcus exiguus]NRD54803.1 hypothetical protein [Corallococcus exiguus]